MWKNATSYSKGEDRTQVRTTSLKVDGLEVIVTKYIGHGDELVMHCHTLGIQTKSLGTDDMQAAQQKALRIVESAVNKINYALEQLKI